VTAAVTPATVVHCHTEPHELIRVFDKLSHRKFIFGAVNVNAGAFEFHHSTGADAAYNDRICPAVQYGCDRVTLAVGMICICIVDNFLGLKFSVMNKEIGSASEMAVTDRFQPVILS